MLTTTNRPLRDRATRALYWFGRRSSKRLFDLTLQALDVNDIYVPERLLAASYGVAMATIHEASAVPRAALKDYATTLKKELLSSDARMATTHFLARDYTAKTIELSRRYGPPKIQQPRCDLPSCIRDPRGPGRGDDQRYEDANWALHMDFENYTVGRLVRDRGNYDMEHKEYREILSAIRWRVHELGYRQDRFAEIDRWIAEREWRRDQQAGRTERYGKKYSWIASYEMAGDLADRGVLDLKEFMILAYQTLTSTPHSRSQRRHYRSSYRVDAPDTQGRPRMAAPRTRSDSRRTCRSAVREWCRRAPGSLLTDS